MGSKKFKEFSDIRQDILKENPLYGNKLKKYMENPKHGKDKKDLPLCKRL